MGERIYDEKKIQMTFKKDRVKKDLLKWLYKDTVINDIYMDSDRWKMRILDGYLVLTYNKENVTIPDDMMIEDAEVCTIIEKSFRMCEKE